LIYKQWLLYCVLLYMTSCTILCDYHYFVYCLQLVFACILYHHISSANDTLVKLSVLKLYHVIKDPWNNSINEQSKPISIKTQTYTENKIELWQESFNCGGQQIFLYQQIQQSPLILTHWTQTVHHIWRWKSR
jgi:hypothetical protein